MFGKSSPDKILKDVEIYLKDVNVPNYAAVQALKKGIKSFPDSEELRQKLKEIENTSQTHSSPKAMYGVLVIAISIMGLGLVYSWAANLTNDFGGVLGILFIVGALIIYKQYRIEK